MVRILSPHLQVKIREMRNQGLTISAIAETLKLTRITVSKYAKKKKIIRQRYVTHKLGRGKVLTAAVIRKAIFIRHQSEKEKRLRRKTSQRR
ncbi:MAG: hypothetical protein EZS28_018752 [Streblomastix strix]|uniref:Uncharacterized protein n=1 Tax=Streblomastix strix TaxID=222440 RepID=A0A5J4VTV0_9EUKA|nr:MAG: hypothetical protein EZS28_018752 [Streblomastix strix]